MGKAPIGIIALILVLLNVSCASAVAPAPQTPVVAPAAAPAPAPAAKAPSKAAWEAEWEQLVEGAKKEGRVHVQASSGEHRPFWSAAMERYGLQVEMLVGLPAESAQKTLTERRVGIYTGDIFTGGTGTPLTVLKPKGAFDPLDNALIWPEVKDPKMWYQGKLPYLDNDHTIFLFVLFIQPTLAINTNLVKPGDIKSYNDLLDPKWRGKMAMRDPSKSGSGGSFASSVGGTIMGWDYMRKLAENKPILMTDDHLRLEWLALGKIAIAIGPQATELAIFQKVGAPVAALIPEEGGWLSAGSGSMAMFNRAAHPNAAKVFLNWLLSKEGQTLASKATGSQSARIDVPTDFLDPVLLRENSKKAFQKETEENILLQPEHMKIAAEVFKDLLK